MSRLYAALPIFAQNLACSISGLRRERERFTPHFRETLARWEQSADWPRARLRAQAAAALARVVERARTASPFYRDLPPACADGDPDTAIARTLATIPVLEKSVYRDRFDDLVARDLPRRRLVRLATSGTTGTSLPVLHTRERLAEWYAVAWRQRRRAGVSLGDPHFTFGGQPIVPLAQRRPPFWRHNVMSRQVLFSTYHLAPEYLPAYVEAVHTLPARYVQGYPSAVHLVARALLDAGRPLPAGRLRGVFTSSETLLDLQRADIARAFGAPVFDYYSATEACIAMSGCPAGRLHVDHEFCLVEVEVTESSADWERGELLATSLGPDAVPFLRYRIGDVGTRARGACPCGRAGESFLWIDGRIEDYVVTSDGRRIGRMDHVFKDQPLVAEAQFVQETDRALRVLVVPRPGFDAAAELGLRAEIERRVGAGLAIEIVRVAAIAREPNGKLRAVKSRVGRLAA
ncbi:MAG: phenylacetate--CoA ligase family protein [Deltaproteobacteria bacterium]|nr:phenylacetate--CoA ligase family protein [Deltaproteobacteria bacterium]